MINFNFILKIIIQIFVVISFLSTLNAKNSDKFDKGRNVSDYFSGILLLNDNKYNESYKFLKKLDGLEESHKNYSSQYLFSLINTNKLNEAFNYAKKLEKINSSTFESDLIIGVYYLKNEQFKSASNYFLKLKNKNNRFILNDFLASSLFNWAEFNYLDFKISQNKINEIDSRFENLKTVQKTFLRCFYDNEKTETHFKKLVLNNKTDFSRYYYFYASYLLKKNKITEAKNLINNAVKLHPNNVKLRQLKNNLEKSKYKNIFNCQNTSHVVAEIFYIVANALSSQNLYRFSNFYLNISRYLNQEFYSYNTLLAENFYLIGNYKKAKQIYTQLNKHGTSFRWHSAKQISRILIEEEEQNKAIKLLSASYEKIKEKNIYQTYDYARFLKNNEKFKESIEVYSEIIDQIQKDHPLFPKVRDGRGVAYERIGEWEKAEKDLLLSLEANPNQAYVINYLAYSWIEQGIKIEQSLAMLEEANNLKSNDPFIIDSLGWALFKLKKFEESKQYLQTAVKLMPADPIVNDHYGDVLWKNGNKIQARYYWNYVLSLTDTKKDLRKNIKEKLISGL
tara:strand:- start:19220 stop:20914 length:1695 start_codon:yes stop_codon:yes gene_type:complete